MNQETIRVVLGREELALLLHILRARTLPGLEEDPMAGMNDEQAAAAFVAAERSLKARGFIRILEEERQVEIDPVVFALVGSCLTPRFSLLVTSAKPDSQPKARYYHVAPNLTVEHSSPETGVHEFAGVAEPAEMLLRIQASLDFGGKAALECPPTRISELIFEQARDLIRTGDIEGGQALLGKEDMAIATVAALVESLFRPMSSTSFIRVDYGKPADEQVSGFSVLEGQNGLWSLTPAPSGERNRWVDIEPIDSAALGGRMRSLLAD